MSDQNGQNLYPFLKQNHSKTIPYQAADTFIACIREFEQMDVIFSKKTTRVKIATIIGTSLIVIIISTRLVFLRK